MESSGVSSGFTDLSVKQPLYNIRMSYSTSPHWITNENEEGINTTVCRSWDDQFNCIHCSPKHSIFSNDAFGLIIGDQHFPSKVPAFDGDCMACIRLHNLALGQLIDISLHQVVRGFEKRGVVRDSDEFGAAEALKKAMKKGCEIYISYASGSGS